MHLFNSMGVAHSLGHVEHNPIGFQIKNNVKILKLSMILLITRNTHIKYHKNLQWSISKARMKYPLSLVFFVICESLGNAFKMDGMKF